MNRFCASCGKEIGQDVTFCANCGRRPEPAVATPIAAVTPGERSASAGKIILVVAGLLCFVGLLGAVGLYFAGRAIEQKASAAGLDIGSLIQKVSTAVKPVSADPDSAAIENTTGHNAEGKDDEASGTAKDACGLLSKEEVAEAIGTSVEKVTPEAEGSTQSKCTYTPGGGQIYPVVLEINWANGKTSMAMLQSAGNKLVAGSENGSGLGDASFFLPMDVGLWVLKEDKLFSLNFGLAPVSKEKNVQLAEKVLSHLQ